jgi:hypothetical protein
LCIENIKDIGNAKIGNISFCDYGELSNYPDLKILKEAIIPVFKIINTDNSFNLQSGFIDRDNKFFICPITISFFCINIISYNKQTKAFETVIKVFNKDSIDFTLKKVYGKDGDSIQGSFGNLISVLNLVNIYVDRGSDIRIVTFENVKRKNLYYVSKNEIISEAVNNLTISFFETGKYAQKDNEFQTDIEIGNLPLNSYLSRLVYNNLLNNYKAVSVANRKILIFLKVERYSSPSFKRRLIENTNGWEMKIKDNLKMELAQNFDVVEYKLARLFEE